MSAQSTMSIIMTRVSVQAVPEPSTTPHVAQTRSDTACPTPCSSDVDSDGDVDIQDLLQMITDWGDCP